MDRLQERVEFSELVVPIELVSPDIFAFINNNMNSMPQLPFRMQIWCTATGVTQAGDTVTTNPVYIWVRFVDLEEGPGVGPVVGIGTGGDIAFTGDAAEEGSIGALEAENLEDDSDDEVEIDDSVADDPLILE